MLTSESGYIRKEWFFEVGIWSFLFVTLLFLFSVTTIKFSPDSITYLNESHELYAQGKYSRLYRGPFMALYGAMAIFFSGGNILGILVLPRIAFLLTILSFSILIRSLYGIRSVLYTAIGIIFLPKLHAIGTTYHIDIFVLPPAILATWSLFEAYNRRSVSFAIFSGIFLGIAFLTKEVAVLLTPVWLFGWILFPPYDRELRKVFLFSIGFLGITVLPWFIHVVNSAGIEYLIGKNVGKGGGKFSALTTNLLLDPLSWFMQLPARIKDFYSEYVFSNTRDTINDGPYGWLLIFSQIVVFSRALIWRKKEDLFVVGMILTFLPLLIYLGSYFFNPRQSVIIQIFAFASVGCLLSTFLAIVNNLCSKFNINPRLPVAKKKTIIYDCWIVAMSVLFILPIPFVTSATRNSFVDGPAAFNFFIESEHRFQPTGTLRPVVIEVGKWLKQNLYNDQTVMTTYRRNAKLLKSLLKKNVVPFPVQKSNIKYWRQDYLGDEEKGYPKNREILIDENDFNNPILIFLNRPSLKQWQPCISLTNLDKVSDHFCKFYFVDENNLFDEIERQKVTYIVVGPKFNAMTTYYDQSPAFELVYIAETQTVYEEDTVEHAYIYKVIGNDQLPNFVPVVSSTFPVFLQAYQRLRPEEYSVWKEEILEDKIGLYEETLDQIIQGNATCFDRSHWNGEPINCERMDVAKYLQVQENNSSLSE